MSIHLRFDYGEVVFKYNMRLDFQCMWSKALTPFKGSKSRSPIVTLNGTRT